MSTPEYFAQPNFISSCRRLLATDILMVLPNETSHSDSNYPLRRKTQVLEKGLEYLRSVRRGYHTAHMGMHSAAFLESKGNYDDVSTLLGDETKSMHFPAQIDGYCRTLEALLACQECPGKKISEVKSFFERIAQLKIKEEPVYAGH